MDKKRILLIDDEAMFTRTLKAYLEATGRYEVHTESGGQEGLAAARTFQPDLILLDVIMPDMDGGQVAAHLKEDPSLKDTPVVFLTAVVSRDEVKAHAGAIAGQIFMAKPVSAKDVMACIERSTGPVSASEQPHAP